MNEILEWKLKYIRKYEKFLESPEYRRYFKYLTYAKAGRYDLILEDN